MESIKIPTAEEFIGMNYSNNHKEGKTVDFSTCVDKMKSYAKLHVEAALEAAAEGARGRVEEYNIDMPPLMNGKLVTNTRIVIDKYSIANAYPLTNIV